MASFYVIEAANLFLGLGSQSSTDEFLCLRSVMLPKLEEIKVPFFPGGAPGEIELSLGLKAPICEFSIAGQDPDTMKFFGASQNTVTIGGAKIPGWGNAFTIYEAARDKVSNNASGIVAQIQGRISQGVSEPFKRGELAGQVFLITEIIYYRLLFAGVEIYNWNWFNNWTVNGLNQAMPVIVN